MQPVIGKIEQLTNRPSPPKGGSGVKDKITIPIEINTTTLDEAQKKADKLKTTLTEIKELIDNLNSNNDIFTNFIKLMEKSMDYHQKRHESLMKRFEDNQERIKRWRT